MRFGWRRLTVTTSGGATLSQVLSASQPGLESPVDAAHKAFSRAAAQHKLPFVGLDTGVSDNFVTSG